MLAIASKVESGGRGEDRLVVERMGGRVLVVVADGAGGSGGGGRAAQAVCDGAAVEFRGGRATDAWAARLRRIDLQLRDAGQGGLSTAVVAEISEGQVVGASVGDSGAWLVSDDGIVDLTEHQIVK